MPLHDNNDNKSDVCHAEISEGDAFHKEELQGHEEEEPPLPHDQHDNNDTDEDEEEDDDDTTKEVGVVSRCGPTLLQRQVIRVIESSAPLMRDGGQTLLYKVRPALLVTQLGLSMDDATEELCGLLSAVGSLSGTDVGGIVARAASGSARVAHCGGVWDSVEFDFGDMTTTTTTMGSFTRQRQILPWD